MSTDDRPRIAAARSRRVPPRIRCIVVLASLLLTGCSHVYTEIEPLEFRPDVKLTPAQARADLARRQDQVQELLGGLWMNMDNFIATSCGDHQGFYYYGGRNRDTPVTDRAEMATKVTTWWKEHGYTVSFAKYGDEYTLGGDAENGTSIVLFLDSDRTWMSTDGPCVPGDGAKIGEEDFAKKRNTFNRTPTPWPTPWPAETDRSRRSPAPTPGPPASSP